MRYVKKISYMIILSYAAVRKEVGLELFFPQELIDNMKVRFSTTFTSPCFKGMLMNIRRFVRSRQSKQLRKLIQQTFQQFSLLKEQQCIMKFFETLFIFSSFDEEVFPCELVVSSPSFTFVNVFRGLNCFSLTSHSSAARLERVCGSGHWT